MGPSGSIADCVERKNCDPRHARRVMQDSMACTAWNIAEVALHASWEKRGSVACWRRSALCPATLLQGWNRG
jgi:hypothetical protein